MSNWAGFQSPELGHYPVELQFSVDSLVAPSWVGYAIRNRSGWLGAAEVEMVTEFDTTREIVWACVDDSGQVLGKWVTDALFSMECRLPVEASEEPPEELDDALDAAYWDFLGRCDLMHLQMLADMEAATEVEIARLEARRQDVYDRVETRLSELYARRRRQRDDADAVAAINKHIALIDEKQSETEAWHRGRLKQLSAELELFDNIVMENLRNHGKFTPLYAVHWRVVAAPAKSLSKRELIDATRLPVAQDLSGLRSPYVTADLLKRSVRPQLWGSRKQLAAQAASDRQTHAERQARLADRALAASLNIPVEMIIERRAREERARQEAEANRKKPLVFKPPPPAYSLTLKAAASQSGVTVLSKGKRGAGAGVAKLKATAESKDRDRPLDLAVALEKGRRKLLIRAFDELAIARAIEDKDLPLPPEPAAPIAPTQMFTVPVQSEEPAAAAGGPAPSSGEAVGEDVADLAVAVHTATKDDVEDLLAELPEMRVTEGTTVLLRFTDGGLGRFIRYTLKRGKNDPQRGILAMTDPRVASMLDKRVGDAVELHLGEKHRSAVIETISVGELQPPLHPTSMPAGKKIVVVKTRDTAVEIGDTAVLLYFEGRKAHFYHCVVPPGCDAPLSETKLSRNKERARAILGRKVGDELTVWLGSGERRVRIDRILKP